MQADAVIIGAGVIGASIAFELARGGRSVVVVDKAAGIGHGSTSASSAVVRFTFSTWPGVAISWEAKFAWEAWHDHLGCDDPAGMAKFIRTGVAMLDVDVVPHSLFLQHFDTAGGPYEIWDTATLARRIPGIDTGRYFPPRALADDRFWNDAQGTLGAIYTPDGGFITDPQLATHNLAHAAQRRGAEFLLRQTVVAIDDVDDAVHGRSVRSVRLGDGSRIDCGIVVNATGPWSGPVNRLAGVGDEFTVTTRPLRQEVSVIPAPSGCSPAGHIGIGVADLDLGTYWRPELSGELLIGGTEPACDPLQWLDTPEEAHPTPTAEVYEAQAHRAARRLPGLTVPHRPRGAVGVYDVSDDWMPIYDRTDLNGYYVAIGTSGNQFKNAPMVGQIMTSIIDRVENGGDHDSDPALFSASQSGALINLGAFSRLRAVSLRNTGTVVG